MKTSNIIAIFAAASFAATLWGLDTLKDFISENDFIGILMGTVETPVVVKAAAITAGVCAAMLPILGKAWKNAREMENL